MRPSQRLLWLLLAWTLGGLLPTLWPTPAAVNLWLAGGAVLLLLAAVDALLARASVIIERRCAPILAVGVWSTVRLRLSNPNRRPQIITIFDHYPQPAEFAGLPQQLRLAPGQRQVLCYRLRPLARGTFRFAKPQALLNSRLELWQYSLRPGAAQAVKVYPDFAKLAEFTLLAHDRRTSAMGIHLRRRRGQGHDFFQLREYRDDDSLRYVDWNATARHRKLITKDYQDQRDQRVLLLLDSSRRMRAREDFDALSHFDHVLNSAILLAFVALRQGDAVGLQSFGGSDRWLASRKGPGALNALINAAYDLQPSLASADYVAAATTLLARQRKRALVVLLTNLRDEDADTLLPALKLLRQRHLVLLASLRETVLDEVLRQPPADTPDQAALYAATCAYLADRDRYRRRLSNQGVELLDTAPQRLPVAIVNHYLALKRSGRF